MKSLKYLDIRKDKFLYRRRVPKDLAEKANVMPKTLYHQFGCKENLLHIAVVERFRHTYRAINDHKAKKGSFNLVQSRTLPIILIDVYSPDF